MKSLQVIVLTTIIVFLVSCGGSGDGGLDIQAEDFQRLNGGGFDTINLSLQTTVANAYCGNQRKFQLISASLLSAYSPKGNGSDTSYCGGENVYVDDGSNFTLHLSDYCIENHGKQYLLNGDISGATESGSNFTSTIASLTITGENVDLSISGETWDGRADDNFVNLTIFDNLTNNPLSLTDTSIKKGELDFGYFSYPGFQSVHYQFITHFNDDNTEGLLYFYGNGDDKIIVSADNGSITAVYSADRHDPGTSLTLSCGL